MSQKNIYRLANALVEKSSLWISLLQEIVEYTDSIGAVLLFVDRYNPELAHSNHLINVKPKDQQRYETYFNKIDPLNTLLQKKSGMVLHLQDLAMKAKNIEVEEEFMQPCGFGNRFAMNLPCNEQFSFNIYVNRDKPYSRIQKKRNTALMYNLKSPIIKAMTAERDRSLIKTICNNSDSMNQLFGYFILDQHLHLIDIDLAIHKLDCIWLNQLEAKKKLVRDLTPITLFKKVAFPQKNQKNIQMTIDGKDFEITILHTSILMGINRGILPDDSIIVVFRERNNLNSLACQLTHIHKLTHTEVEMALKFKLTPCLSTIAKNNHKSIETIRIHLKRVMKKLNVHSQAELIQYLYAFNPPYTS